jgi:hypothetical protein
LHSPQTLARPQPYNVLGLVFASSQQKSFQLPHGNQYEELKRDAQLPNQFRCQTSKPYRLIEKARPKAVRNLPKQSLKTEQPVSRSASPSTGGNDLETANEFWWS